MLINKSLILEKGREPKKEVCKLEKVLFALKGEGWVEIILNLSSIPHSSLINLAFLPQSTQTKLLS